jgi:hypothetical protein
LLSDGHISFAIALIAMIINHPILDFFIFDQLLKAFPTDFMQAVKENVFENIFMLATLHLFF